MKPNGMVCVSVPCHDHKHKRHPGIGHCDGCIDEQNEGWRDVIWTFDSRKATGDERCCCRDSRIGQKYRGEP